MLVDERKIVWEKYVHPLLAERDESWDSNIDDEDEDDDLSPWEEKEQEGFINLLDLPKAAKGRFVVSPYGLHPLTDSVIATSHFDLWSGYTNFRITDEVMNAIANVDGVESLDIITPHRFRVGIMTKGGLFKGPDVRQEIQRSCGIPSLHDKISNFAVATQEEILTVHNELNLTYDYWTIFVLPNGKINYCFAEKATDEDFAISKQFFTETHHYVGGILLSSKELSENSPE